MTGSKELGCPYSKTCTGCTLWDLPYLKQLETKKNQLKAELAQFKWDPVEIEALSAGQSKIRDRIDFTIENGAIGLYSSLLNKVLDLPDCPLMSPELSSLYHKFYELMKTLDFKIKKGSFRLRVSPWGETGIWLDFANLDIKHLLEEKNFLLELMNLGLVEIGQKRKKLVQRGDLLKLDEPQPKAWTRTWMKNEDNLIEIPLFSAIGSFSQSGDQNNKLITSAIREFAEQINSQQIIEFGSGFGNLSFSVLNKNRKLAVCENDLLAIQGFQETLNYLQKNLDLDLKKQIQFFAGDHQLNLESNFEDYDTILVNPPRSGLKNFLNPLFKIESSKRPKNLIYMSCYLHSFLEDCKNLKDLGYKPYKVKIIDQFPNTDHMEILTLFSI